MLMNCLLPSPSPAVQNVCLNVSGREREGSEGGKGGRGGREGGKGVREGRE